MSMELCENGVCSTRQSFRTSALMIPSESQRPSSTAQTIYRARDAFPVDATDRCMSLHAHTSGYPSRSEAREHISGPRYECESR